MSTVARNGSKRLPGLDTEEGELLILSRLCQHQYVTAFLRALLTMNPAQVRQIHADLNNEDQETYLAVWSYLNSRERTAIKSIVADVDS